MKKALLIFAAASMAMPAVPAIAHDRYDNGYSRYHDDDDGHRSRGRHRGSHRSDHRGNSWRGDDGRYYCRRANGTVGLVVGAAGGALLGRAVDTRGERSTGTILGAAAGALLGREVARGQVRCR